MPLTPPVTRAMGEELRCDCSFAWPLTVAMAAGDRKCDICLIQGGKSRPMGGNEGENRLKKRLCTRNLHLKDM